MNEEMLKKLAGGGKSPEEVLAIAKNRELDDETLDGVAGGLDYLAAFSFKRENCASCGHWPNDCPYGSAMDGLFAATSMTCPSKTAR